MNMECEAGGEGEGGAQQENRRELTMALDALGLKLRSDSAICAEYIQFRTLLDMPTTAEDVAKKMAESHYLHNYCDFQGGYRLAHNTIQFRRTVLREEIKQTNQEWLDLIRECVLATTRQKDFPARWPWLDGVEPKTWMQEYDMTDEIFRQRRKQCQR